MRIKHGYPRSRLHPDPECEEVLSRPCWDISGILVGKPFISYRPPVLSGITCSRFCSFPAAKVASSSARLAQRSCALLTAEQSSAKLLSEPLHKRADLKKITLRTSVEHNWASRPALKFSISWKKALPPDQQMSPNILHFVVSSAALTAAPPGALSSKAPSDVSSTCHMRFAPSTHRGPGYAPYFGRASRGGRRWRGLGLSAAPGVGAHLRAVGPCHAPGRRRSGEAPPGDTEGSGQPVTTSAESSWRIHQSFPPRWAYQGARPRQLSMRGNPV